MILVPSAQVIEFLSKSAPRPWIKRMLHGMVLNNELAPYFTAGKCVAKTSAIAALMNKESAKLTAEEMRSNLDDHFDPEVANQIHVAHDMDEIEELTGQWNIDEEARQVSVGWFVYAEEID